MNWLRLTAGAAAVAIVAALSAGAIALAERDGHLQRQVAGLTAQRDARHTAFCAYLRAEARLYSVPPGLSRLAVLTYQAEACP